MHYLNLPLPRKRIKKPRKKVNISLQILTYPAAVHLLGGIVLNYIVIYLFFLKRKKGSRRLEVYISYF